MSQTECHFITIERTWYLRLKFDLIFNECNYFSGTNDIITKFAVRANVLN